MASGLTPTNLNPICLGGTMHPQRVIDFKTQKNEKYYKNSYKLCKFVMQIDRKLC